MNAWFDPQWVLAFQTWAQSAEDWWRALSFLGDETFYLLLFPTLYWAVSAPLGLRLGLALLLSAQINGVLKLAFHSPRPFWVDPRIRAGVPATSFGLPSGHSQNAVVLWGRWGWHARPWARGAALGLAGLIGLSRVALGVHFWGDVLIGWAVGALVLAALLAAEPRVRAWVVRAGPWPAAWAGVALAGVVVLLAAGLRALGQGTTPAAWAQAWSLDGVLTAAGTWAGLVLGWAWLRSRGGFDARGPWKWRILRVMVGLVGVLALWAGLRAVLPAGDGWVPAMARVLRYGLIGVWVAGVAPYLFRAWGWAQAP